MKFDETILSGARWSEFAEANWGDWNFLWEDSEASYQGSCEFIAYKGDRWVYSAWSYGSCSGCDPWEDMEYKEAKADFDKAAVYFDSFDQMVLYVKNHMPYHKDKIMDALGKQILDNEFDKLLEDK